MIGSLLILGFTLSLDNFRTAIALGGLRLTWRRSVQVALVFGLVNAVIKPVVNGRSSSMRWCILSSMRKPLVSSKVNQWTLLVGTLPIVFAISSASSRFLSPGASTAHSSWPK